MAESMSLITAQIAFLDPPLAVIHIPIGLYALCLQPVLRLLFGEGEYHDPKDTSWTNGHEFLNISITSIECSMICTRELAEEIVRPVANVVNKLCAGSGKNSSKLEIEISSEDYTVIQVDGEGLDAGQRVLELTSPLAMAGISIFFITTYFSDYILVPLRSRQTVTKALQQRGFVFSQSADAFVSQLSPSSPTLQAGMRSMNTSFLDRSSPTTPPAKDIPELQVRTFTKLKQNNITPLVDEKTRLVNCAGSRECDIRSEEQLKNDLLQVLLSTSTRPHHLATGYTPKKSNEELGSEDAAPLGSDDESCAGARFLSITITSEEPISILLEHRLLDRLGGSLLGAKGEEDALIPISMDLRDLPLDATGIVCGLAGRLAQGSMDEGDNKLNGQDAPVFDDEQLDISFLSTARAGTVIVRASQLKKALEALQYGMEKVAVTKA